MGRSARVAVCEPAVTRKSMQLVYDIIGAAMEVHTALGPGLPGERLSRCVAHRARERAVRSTNASVPVRSVYRGRSCARYRLDLVVERQVHRRAQGGRHGSHPCIQSQMLSYLKPTGSAGRAAAELQRTAPARRDSTACPANSRRVFVSFDAFVSFVRLRAAFGSFAAFELFLRLPATLPSPPPSVPAATALREATASFHALESPLELLVRHPQRRLGFDAEFSRQVDEREEQIAHLLLSARAIGGASLHDLFELGELFLDLREHVFSS